MDPDGMIDAMARQRRELAQGLEFADASVWLGPPQGFPLAREMLAGEIGAAFDRHFIRSGLVSHWHATVLSPQDGNRALEAAAPLLPRSCGVIWTGLPLLAGEAEPLPGLSAVPERLGGVRIFPKTHRFPLAAWVLGPLCEWMSERQLPLFIWHTELDWSALRELARAFPALPVVVESQPQKILYHARPLFTLMGECPNLLVETSNFVGQGFVEHAVGRFGGERLLFGTFLPVGDPLVPIGMLVDADIAAADKALIAGGNLRRLLQRAAASADTANAAVPSAPRQVGADQSQGRPQGSPCGEADPFSGRPESSIGGVARGSDEVQR